MGGRAITRSMTPPPGGAPFAPEGLGPEGVLGEGAAPGVLKPVAAIRGRQGGSSRRLVHPCHNPQVRQCVRPPREMETMSLWWAACTD